MSLNLRRFLFLAAMLLVVVSLGLSFLWDMQHRIEGLETLMVDHAGVISDIVAEANWHGLQVYQRWEDEIARRLLNNAAWLARMADLTAMDQAVLRGYATDFGLNQIWILDGKGGLIAATDPEHAAACLDGFPREFVFGLISGLRQSSRLGFHRRGDIGCWCYVVGAARAGGGAVLVDALGDSLVALRRQIGPGHLIKSIGEGRSVKYVVFQDETGTQASSTAEISFLLPGADPDLQPLREGSQWVAKEFDSPLGRVYEVAQVVPMFSGDALLRVGLNAAPLMELRADIRRRTVLRATVLGISVLLMSALLVAWQRQGALDREVAKISHKLAVKEDEARRAEKLVAMGSLAAGVAHQIRNPLNSIHMIAQMLGRNQELPDEVRDKARHIRDESGRIENIVQEFLDFSRPRAPVFENLDLGVLVREAVSVQESVYHDRNIVLSAYAPGLYAEVDRHFVIEILENMIRNAAEAVGEGGKILVSLIGSDGEAEIAVADDGPGIPEELRPKVFDLYFTTRPEGSGLGLSLADQMTVAMGGTLECSSEPGLDGRGARFVLRLPMRRRQFRPES